MSKIPAHIRTGARICLALVFFSTAVKSGAADSPLDWPAVTNETKPWSRWWWLGNITTEDDLRSLMAKYAAAGLGGLEVTPIYGVRGYESQFIPFLSPTFVDRLEFAAREAKRQGMAIDMSTGTGWPFGGPWVDDFIASRTLATRTFTLSGGKRLSELVVMEQKPVLRFAGATTVDIDAIKQPVSANDNLQELAIDQVRFKRVVPLQTLMAFPAGQPGKGIDITKFVGSTGMLSWVPAAGSGDWTLYAIFSGFHGKMVERAGPGGEGMAIDHFSANALKRYLAPFDAALRGRRLEGFRAWFNDSYEADDATGESNFTAQFLGSFQGRRGYDLRQNLPLLLNPDSGDAGDRVISDYRETISDLLLDEFTIPWRTWASSRGGVMRNQAHGSPANIVDLYAASDIPETEGSEIVQFKTASSAAHLTGKRLASAEALTWLGEHWLSTLGDARRAIDGFFLGGINHICYHGTVYSPPAEPWPGFHFYAAVEFDPSNPLWEHLPALNRYVTRVQSFLQNGQPDEGVLLYYNIHDRWAQRGSGAMPHFHGSTRDGMTAQATGEALLSAGYGFDYVTDRMLERIRGDGTAIVAGDLTYSTVVVPRTRLMPVATLERLIELAKEGATIVFEGGLPVDVPGYAELEDRRRAMAKLISAIELSGRDAGGTQAGQVGRGEVLVAEDVAKALAARSRVTRERMVEHGLRFVRRTTGDDTIYFIVNPGVKRVDGWVPLSVSAKTIALFNPMTGAVGLARSRTSSDGAGEVYLQLDPGKSIIVRTSKTEPSGAAWTYWRESAPLESVSGEWMLTFLRGGPTLPAARAVRALDSWTDLGDADARSFSGTARYVIRFARPESSAEAYALDLGGVAVSARVTLNGTDLGVVFDAPYRLIVPGSLLAERNSLEIDVVNLAANRIAELDRRGVPWKKFYNVNMPPRLPENRGADGLYSAASWKTRESGLLGPVTLTPLSAD